MFKPLIGIVFGTAAAWPLKGWDCWKLAWNSKIAFLILCRHEVFPGSKLAGTSWSPLKRLLSKTHPFWRRQQFTLAAKKNVLFSSQGWLHNTVEMTLGCDAALLWHCSSVSASEKIPRASPLVGEATAKVEQVPHSGLIQSLNDCSTTWDNLPLLG